MILPDWLPLNDDEVLAFLTWVAATPVPLVPYNPPDAKTLVGPELLGRLADAVPTLIGLKTAGGDRAWFEAVKQAAPGCRSSCQVTSLRACRHSAHTAPTRTSPRCHRPVPSGGTTRSTATMP